MCSIGDEYVTFTYADGRRETERFVDIVEQARLYILTDCGGSFERFPEKIFNYRGAPSTIQPKTINGIPEREYYKQKEL